jgi:hypothetical protein
LEKALYKGLVAAGRKVPMHGSILFTVADKHKRKRLIWQQDSMKLVSESGQRKEQQNSSKKKEFLAK